MMGRGFSDYWRRDEMLLLKRRVMSKPGRGSGTSFRGVHLLAGIVVAAFVLGCSSSKPRVEPLQVKDGILTVTNQGVSDWTDVEVWVNTYFRMTAASIPAGGRAQAPLASFVNGWGTTFDARNVRWKDIRLTAKLPDGQTIELKTQAGGR